VRDKKVHRVMMSMEINERVMERISGLLGS